MSLNYTYIKYKDVHSLKNNEPDNMNFTIVKNSCDSTLTLSSNTIAPDETAVLNFVTDGKYTINLSTENGEDSFEIYFYENLLASFITSIEKLLCGCSKCDECEECNECEEYLSAIMKGFSYDAVNNYLYQPYVSLITQVTLCELTDEVVCTITKEKVFGSASVKEPMLKILSYYYLAFYYKSLDLASDQEEVNYINIKYKFDKISKCIKKLGINLDTVVASL